jgi:hypothetical protein
MSLVALVCVAFVGCGGDSGGDAVTDPEPPIPMSLSESSISFAYFDRSAEFSIENTGDAQFSWTATSSAAWVKLDVAAGDLGGGLTTPVEVSIDRDGLATGGYSASVTVAAAGVGSRSVSINLMNYGEDLFVLDFVAHDVEFDEIGEKWIVVSQSPPRMHVVDAVEKTFESVTLTYVPQCVGLRPDGAYAAVGHSAWITRVDMGTLIPETPLQTTVDANDIVLAQNGFAYVFPRGSGWDNLRSVELPAGTETPDDELIYRGMVARQQPNADYIYAADNGISPSGVEKFDISSGVAAYLWDEPGHGDYNYRGNLWFSYYGTDFVARSGNAFRTAVDQLNDMVYIGGISDVDYVTWADQAHATAKWYVCHEDIWGDLMDEIRVYTGTTFAYESSYTVPSIPRLVGGGVEPFQATHCFVNSTGTALHVIGIGPDASHTAVASIALQ